LYTTVVMSNQPLLWDSCKCIVNPVTVLLVPRLVGIPGALLQQCQCDLVVDVLLEHVLVSELHMPIDVLQLGPLAKADDLVVDEAILDVVELVHVLHNGLTLVLYKVLEKTSVPMGTLRPM